MTPPVIYVVRLPRARVIQLITAAGGAEHGPLTAWMLERDRGWVELSTVSDDPDRPFERAVALYDTTTDFNSWAIEDEDARHSHIDGQGLGLGWWLFEFKEPSIAVEFKLMFGGE